VSGYWRMTAKHTTICPRCDAIILRGSDTIVKDPEGGPWVHAICGKDREAMASRSMEEVKASAKVTVINFDSKGEIV
jgi:hypothetical protein